MNNRYPMHDIIIIYSSPKDHNVFLTYLVEVYPHMNRVPKLIGNKLYVLNKLLKRLSYKISSEIYKVMLLPSTEYGVLGTALFTR